MTALVASRLIKQLAPVTTRRFPVAAATACWEGGMVALSGAGSAAVAVPASANAALKVVGVAQADGNNLTGAAGATTVDASVGTFLMNNSATDPLALGDIGSPCYAQDDNTVSKTGAPASGSLTQPQAGYLWNLDPSGGVWVRFL
ncbi:MAG: hypothetical protein ACLPGW_19470 [Roseiarcus sp.]